MFFGGSADRLGRPGQGRHPAGRRAAAAADQPDPGDEPRPEAAAALLVLPAQPQGGRDRHRRRPRQRRDRRALQPVPGQQPGWLLGRGLDLSAVLLLRLPEHPAVRLRCAGVHEPGLRGRRARQHELRRTTPPASHRDDLQHPAGAVAVELPEPARAGQQPTALHRVERLVVAGECRAGQRDAAGHELLLLARLVGAEPARFHDRLGHADAVRRPERRACSTSTRPPRR